jgi:hypothetical protein
MSNQFLFTTVKIKGKTEEGPVYGTGFFYAFNSSGNGRAFNALITCRHVLKDMSETHLLMRFASVGQTDKIFANLNADWVKINFGEYLVYHPDKEIDLCGIPLDTLKIERGVKGLQNPIVMTIPDNMALPDEKLSSSPLLRKFSL